MTNCYRTFSYFHMIAIPLTTDINPGNPADEHYEDVTRVYDSISETFFHFPLNILRNTVVFLLAVIIK